MPKYVELGHEGVIHESEIFGAVPPCGDAENETETEKVDGN